MNRDLEALFAAHDYISREIGMAEAEMDDGEFKEGHINGLKEGRNRVEQAITEFASESDGESPLKESNQENPERYYVYCEECGVVEFDVLDDSSFSNPISATWYAGYHGGDTHGESEYQHGSAFRVSPDGRVGLPENTIVLGNQKSFAEVLAERTGRDVAEFELTEDMSFPELDELDERE